MRNLRRLGALLLALVMCLALSIPAFAAEADVTVTINGAKPGVTYAAYKLAAVTVSGGTTADGKHSYAYRLDDASAAWKDFWVNTVGATVPDTNYIVWDEASRPVTDSATMMALGKDARQYAADNGITAMGSVTPTAEGAATITITGGGDGYYLVTSSAGFTSMMETSADGAIVIDEKNVAPSITQYIMGNPDHDCGVADCNHRLKSATGFFDDVFSVTAVIDVPVGSHPVVKPVSPAPMEDQSSKTAPARPATGNGTGLTALEATFAFDTGLVRYVDPANTHNGVQIFGGDENVGGAQQGGVPTYSIGVMHNEGDHYGRNPDGVSATVYGSGGATAYDDQADLFTVETTANGFKVTFKELFLNDYVAAGDRIVIYYNMQLTSDAKVSTKDGYVPNTSRASLKYGDGLSAEGGKASEVDVYTLSMPIYKYSENNDDPLSDATFTMAVPDWGTGDDAAVWFTKGASGYMVDWSDDGTRPVVTDDTGYATLVGIGGSDCVSGYALTETEAPAGYNKLAADLSIVPNCMHEPLAYYPERVNDVGEDKLPERNSAATLHKVEFTVNGGDVASQVGVANASGSQMPETGGDGVTMILVAGAILVAMAGTGYMVYRRKED